MAAEFSALDQQKFGRFHIKAILVSGIGFFTDAMDIFIINLAIPMIAFVWYFDKTSDTVAHAEKMPSTTKGLLKASTQIGTLIGQLLFGYLSDKLGRKSMYGVVLAIMIVATINTSLAADTKGLITVGTMLIIWRLVLGVGIGGDYPISAVITSEFASVSTRGFMVAAVFAMQGLGILVGSLCAVIVLAAMKPGLLPVEEGTFYNAAFDNVWRLLLFLGVVPAIAAVYWRLSIPETPRFTAAKGDVELAMKDLAKCVETPQPGCSASSSSSPVPIKDESDFIDCKPGYLQEKYSHLTFSQIFGNWKNGKILFGTAASWFLLDIGFYGVQLNQSEIIKFMGYGKGATAYEYFFNQAIGNLLLSLCGTVPGYWFTVFLVEKLGRIKIQLIGFTALSVIFVVLTVFFHSLEGTTGFFVLFILANFFFNFGPNTTTFILPAEIFPTKYRSTCHGISAAAGKAGAIIAAFGFDQLKGKNGENMTIILAIFSACMIAGLACTFLIPETKGKTLEELGDSFYTEDIVSQYPAPETPTNSRQ